MKKVVWKKCILTDTIYLVSQRMFFYIESSILFQFLVLVYFVRYFSIVERKMGVKKLFILSILSISYACIVLDNSIQWVTEYSKQNHY